MNIKHEYPSSDMDLKFLSGISLLTAFPISSAPCKVQFVQNSKQIEYGKYLHYFRWQFHRHGEDQVFVRAIKYC